MRSTCRNSLLVCCLALCVALGSGPALGQSVNKLRVGTVITLEGLDADSNSYEETFWVSGRAFLPFTEGKRFLIGERVQDDLTFFVRWDKDGNAYRYGSGQEFPAFVNGPVGSTFSDGESVAEVVAVGETVVVPAGTFHDCVQVVKEDIGGSPPWIEWWKPGLFIVKWTDYWVLPEELAPVEWEMVSLERYPSN